MLTIHVITVGRDKESWVSDQIDHYRKLLTKYARLELTVVPEARYTKATDLSKALGSEADAIRSRLRGGYRFILDVGGRGYATESLAMEIDRLKSGGYSLLEFVIGGPFGLDPSLKQLDKQAGSGQVISLSPLTMSHQIARLILLEQLYRVLNLNAGGSYHK
jgi:23S rRNA (pseudouridine1915-N3)-methyltransferase